MLGRAMRGTIVCLAVLLAIGCGTRTTLDVDPPNRDPDGGFDAGPPDAGRDAGPPDGGVLVVDCGRSVQPTSPRRPLMLEAEASSPTGIVEQGWSLVSSPPGASAEVVPGADPSRVTVTPDAEGDFLMRYEAVDGSGRMGSCEVTVQSVVGPPVALCPEEELRTIQDEPIVVTGDGYDDEMVVAFQWELVEAPPGASPSLLGLDTPVVQLTASTRGTYRLRLTVFDADMATGSCEVAVLVTGPPEVSCPMSPVTGPTRQPLTLRARATDDLGIASRGWELLRQPSGSVATPTPPDADETRLTPDRQGEYQLRFTATDVEGLSASCEVTVIGTPTPPEVTCPETITTPPLRPVEVVATAEDDGTIASWRWSTSARPDGSTAGDPSPRNAAATEFTPDIAGVYELTVVATDDDGMTGTCTTRVEAGNVDGLRVEMFWDVGGSTDMDLHLLNPDATRWTSDNDCYYGNCNTNRSGVPILDWYGPDDEDDPRLDIDDTTGFGPENINITRPEPGTYRVGVHNFDGAGPHGVTVNIYCGGSTTVPRRTFGPVSLRGRGGSSRNDFWRVADVNITAAGCTITDLSRPDGSPWIEVYGRTRDMR
jgi:hypothetical protein